jgi:hypothetical protein
MEVSNEIVDSYVNGREAGREAIAAKHDTKAQRIVAARGMRINAAKAEAPILSPARSLSHVLGEATAKANRLSGAALLSAAAKAVEHFHKHDHKPATATTVTRYLKSDDGPAARYALDPKVTGALVSLKMRVKRNKHQGPTPGNSAPRKATDVIACRMIDARSRAVRDIEQAINGLDAAPNAHARKRGVSRVRAMLHTWAADPAVVEAARLCGWHC